MDTIEKISLVNYENAGHVKEFIDELEEDLEKNKKELNFLFEKYNKFVNFTAYKIIKE